MGMLQEISMESSSWFRRIPAGLLAGGDIWQLVANA
jgi:hypothetical protein